MYIYLSVCPLHDPGLILGRGAEYLKRFVPDSSRAGARRKSPNDAPWETPCQGLVRPISAPLLGVALSWRQGKKLSSKAVNKSSGWSGGCLDYMVNLIKNSCEVSCDPMYRCEPPLKCWMSTGLRFSGWIFGLCTTWYLQEGLPTEWPYQWGIGANSNAPIYATWDTPSQRLSRLISA